MKYFLAFSFILITYLSAIGQFDPSFWGWNDSLLVNQKQYCEHGDVIILENKKEGGKLKRFQYYEDGKLQLVATIKQSRVIDTLVAFDPKTFADTEEILKRIRDIPNGKYQELYQSGSLKVKGKMADGKKIGRWVSYGENKKPLKKVSYDKKGRINGLFISYHPNGKVMTKGKVETKVVETKSTCIDPITFERKECILKDEVVKQVGKWKTYDSEGNLTEEVIH